MRRHGLTGYIRVLSGDYTEESGASAARMRLGDGRLPTGVFAASDRCAHGLLCALARAGVTVPGQMSIVSYDDSRIARRGSPDHGGVCILMSASSGNAQ